MPQLFLLFVLLTPSPALADGAGVWTIVDVPALDEERTGPPPTSAAFVTTSSGIQIAQLTHCANPRPQSGQTVEVHYDLWVGHGIGPVVDSSYVRGRPFTYKYAVGHVIKGFDEAIGTMSPGCKIRVIIPPALGYGVPGRPRTIPPNTDLVFDIEMLSIK